MNDEYKYKNCPLTKPSLIRVLTVRQGGPGDTIECTLTTQSLALPESPSPFDQDHLYEALSYHWGSGEASRRIKIYTEGVLFPGSFRIRANLHAALNQLRLPDRQRKLWIDAICINQDDDEEKNAQVSLMADIFSRATRVCVWLGEAGEESDLALNFISRIVNLADFDYLVRDHRTPQEWAALSALMRRTWFSRRWVVQEIALAARATLYCGDANVDWADFADAVSLFEAVESENHTISKLMMESALFNYIPDFFDGIKFLGATRLVDATSNLFRKSKNGQVLERLLSLEALISNLSGFQASRPHDIIYAVLNLAKGMRISAATSNKEGLVETQSQVTTEPTARTSHEQKLKKLATRRFEQAFEENRFTINYEKPFFDVCKEFLQFTIKSDGFLDTICRPWVPEGSIPESMRPSWLLKTSKTAWSAWKRHDSMVNADTLVGPPGLGKRNYNASGQFKVTDNWQFGKGPKAYSMYVEGFVIDSIKQTQPYLADGVISNEWLTAGGWTDMSSLPPDEFWRTLVANRGPNGVNPPRFYSRACKAALSQIVKDRRISMNTLITYGNSSIVANFLRRVQEVIWMRRLVITEHDLLGLAPKPSQKGDHICIFYGCSVPVALRRMVDPVTDEEYFKFIGECYVHGIMDGEAFALAPSRSDNGQITKKVFELR